MTSTTTRFRSRPVEIEAMRFQKPYAAVALWCDGIILTDGGSQVGGLAIETPDGTMIARIGDWIVRGTAGEFYPVKPDIFIAKYEPVDPK